MLFAGSIVESTLVLLPLMMVLAGLAKVAYATPE